jgi:glycosyltransferase involved in cell wall biosynthesis
MTEPEVLVVGPAGHDTGGIAQYIAEQRRVLGSSVDVRLFDVATPRGSGARWLGRVVATVAWDLLRFPFRSRPAITHVHTSHYRSFYLSAWYVLFAALVWRSRVVVHVHGSSFDEFLAEAGPVGRAFQTFVLRRADRIIVLSSYWFEYLTRRVSRRRLRVVPNAVSPEEYEPVYGVRPPVVTFVSNHVERKGIVEFTEAIETLLQRDSGPEFEVRIAGSGPLSSHAESLAERFDSVSYLGYVSEPEKRELLGESSVFVLPTRAEGLPIAMLEGMAGGNAIVSTRVGSIPDVLTDDHGVLVDTADTDALVEALGTLLDDPESIDRMGRASRQLVESEYSWAAVRERLLSLYRELDGRDAGRDTEPASHHE